MQKSRIAILIPVVFLAACAAPTEEEDRELQTSNLTAGTISARVFGTGSAGLRVRAEPNRGSSQVGSLADNETVVVTCQTTGESTDGTNIWDFIESEGGYVSDAYVWTGHNGFAPGVKRCEGGGATPPPSSSPASSAGATKAISEARSHLGYVESAGKCNWFSKYWGRNGGCAAWCSDFVNYVWMKASFDVGGLGSYSGSFYDYGKKHGTTKTRYATNVKPGDAVLWGAIGGYSAHVGMVTAVSGNEVTVIHGNFEVGPGGAGMVYESKLKSRDDTVGTGYGIYAFVSPVP